MSDLFSWPCLQVFTPPCLSFTIRQNGTNIFCKTSKQTKHLFEFSWWEHSYTEGVLLLSALSGGLHSCTNPAVITSFLVFISEEKSRLFKMPMICRGHACILVCLEGHVSHIKIYETKFQIIMSSEWILWGTRMECTVLHYPALGFAILCHAQLQRRCFLLFCSLQKLWQINPLRKQLPLGLPKDFKVISKLNLNVFIYFLVGIIGYTIFLTSKTPSILWTKYIWNW